MNDTPNVPREVIELDPEEMKFATQLAHVAAARRYHVDNPGETPLHIVGKEETMEVRLTDIPMNRAGIAVVKHFEGDREKAFSCMMRMMALNQLYSDEWDGKLAKWLKRNEDDPEFDMIREEVVALAAIFPLDIEQMEFDVDAFVAELEATVPRYGEE